MALVEAVKTIVEDYTDQLPLTLRQVFYIAVTRSLIGKTEKDYNRLTEMMVRARRAMLIPMASFRDDGFTQGQAAGWQDGRTPSISCRTLTAGWVSLRLTVSKDRTCN